MTDARLQTLIDDAFGDRAKINPQTTGDVRDAVAGALGLLDCGKARVAEKIPGATGPNSWKVNQWLKKAVLLSFRLNDNRIIEGGPGGAAWWDKIPSKFEGWGENRFREAGFRAVPGAIVRRSAFIAPRRDADAELRQSRRLCRRQDHGRHLGHGRLLRANRQERASLGRRRHRRRARAACRRTRPSSRTIASSARAPKSSRA